MHRFYKNNKTGDLYLLLAFGVDTTNSRDGSSVVIYCPDDKENTIYVREETEFYEKFHPVSLDDLEE
jgi:hypothetical protein